VDVYRTDERGTITFTTDGKRLWVRTAKPAAP
jgi:beta-lactamase superfamily II metal-dependent hydrolase